MNIAWYTPFSAASAIGRFSHLVVDELRRCDVKVTLVRSEKKTSEMRGERAFDESQSFVWAEDFDRSSRTPIDDCDLVVYNIGDHFDNHAYCFHHQRRRPGVSVLHDYNLHNALYAFCHYTTPANGTYREQVAAECGQDVASKFDQLLSTNREQDWWQSEISEHPIFRWALKNTLGIITHAEFYRDEVEQRIGCPTAMIPLAYDSPAAQSLTTPAGDEPNDRLRLVTVGAVNANKQYGAIIEALATTPQLRDRIEYRIVGPITKQGRAYIASEIAKHTNPPKVTITGKVTAQELKSELEKSDLLSCLRFPALEGASASVVEAMQSGRPVLVCDTGCYSEIPKELAYHVSPKRLKQDIRSQLGTIVGDMGQATQRAALAKSWALERHSAAAYANSILSFLPRVLYNQPVLDVTDRISRQFIDWNVLVNDTLLDRMDRAIFDLFGPHDQSGRAA